VKTIAVDWDGVLVEYAGYKGPCIYGAPVPLMVQRVKKWIDAGHEVIIHTSRVSIEHDVEVVLRESDAITKTLKQVMNLPSLTITANKFTRISEFWDDRAVRIMRNTGAIGHEDLGIIRRT
jgi:hypothetical protein